VFCAAKFGQSVFSSKKSSGLRSGDNAGQSLGENKNQAIISASFWYIRKQGGLRPKSLCGNTFYKGHIYFREKAAHHFKKAAIP
jgi:hypothetical protein